MKILFLNSERAFSKINFSEKTNENLLRIKGAENKRGRGLSGLFSNSFETKLRINSMNLVDEKKDGELKHLKKS